MASGATDQDFNDAFGDFELKVPVDIHDPKINSAATQNGLSDFQRFVVKNFFDTQKERRRAYLKQYGYEMSKDGEEYRPIGSDGNFQPIDPGGIAEGFLSIPKMFTKEGLAELKRDFSDVAFDVVTGLAIGAGSGALGAAGAAKGAVTGAALTSPTGPGAAVGGTIGGILGGLSGAIAGGTGANALSEGLKQSLGTWLLDENIPVDMEEAIYQSLVAGMLSGAGKGAGDFIKGLKKVKAENYQKALKEAAVRKSNGTWNMKLAEDLAKHPEKYTPEAVKGSQEKLLGLSDDIFGTSAASPKSTRELTGGVAKKAIESLNKRADLEINKLAENPEANFTVGEILDTLEDRMKSIAGKKFKTQDEARALNFFRTEVASLKRNTQVPEGAPDEFQELTFKEGRDLLKRWQNAAFEEGAVKGNPIVRQVSHGLKELADLKAGGLGSDLPAINGKRSEILTTYKNLQQALSPAMMQAAYVGKDSVAKNNVRRVLENADKVLGTNLAEGAETTQFKAAVEKFFESPSAFGSGAVFTDMMREGLSQARSGALKGVTVGSTLGLPFGFEASGKLAAVGGALGGAKGAIAGAKEGAALSSPDTLIQSFSKVKTKLSDLNRDPKALEAAARGLISPTGQAGAQVDLIVPSLPGLETRQAAAATPQPQTPAAAPAPVAPKSAPTPATAEVSPEEFDAAFGDFQLKLPEGL